VGNLSRKVLALSMKMDFELFSFGEQDLRKKNIRIQNAQKKKERETLRYSDVSRLPKRSQQAFDVIELLLNCYFIIF
jgi:hypothetical protein